MKGKTILLFCCFVVFTLISLRPKAQSTCDCWQPRDPSFQAVPFSGYTAPYYRNDDGYTNPITLPFSFCFYGTSVNSIIICNNGFITWGTSGSSIDFEYNATAFPNSLAPIIAPFWADVYTVGGPGIVWYKVTPTYVIVQWDSVGGFSSSSSLENSFQVIISNGTDPIIPNHNNIEFCYQQMQWAVGTASGGTSGFGSTSSSSLDYPAVVGINEGNGTGNIQYGLFNNPNNGYAGSSPPFPYDGLYWLDGQSFVMNGCTGVTGNTPPILTGLTGCPDTLVICVGDTLKVPLNFYTVISGATVHSTLTPPLVTGASIIYNNSTGQNDSLVIQVIGSAANIGYNTVNFIGYDNLTPSDTNFASFVVEVTQPQTISISSITNVTCTGYFTGSATLSVSGGIPAFTYSWSPTGGTTANGTGLSAGTYTVTVTDSKGCTATTTVTITQPPTAVTATTTSTPASCGVNNGTATVTASGGTSPYTYLWTPSGNSNITATGLSAGTYTIIVIDNRGCTGTSTAVVTSSTGFTALISSTSEVSCNGGNNGSAMVVITTVGSPPYTYAWVPTGGTNATGTGLGAGTYTVTVTDNSGCSATASVTITQPTAITATTTSTSASCSSSNGTATVSASGGTPVYTYLWSPSGNSTITATGLSAGTYTITVTDYAGCTYTTTAIVHTTSSSITANITASTSVSCNGGTNGSATVTTSGGIIPYTYAWSPVGGTNATGTGLSAGTYTLNVTDNNGCAATTTVTITQPTLLSGTVGVPTNVSCNGGTNGSATVTVTGGTSPYTYLWASGGGTGATGTGLGAGTYTVTTTDHNGCTATAAVTITQPVALAIATTTTQATCGNSNGTATVSASGGTPVYTYLWTPSANTNVTATGLGVGTYTITVTDNHGCTQTTTAVIVSTSSITAAISSSTNVLCNGGTTGSATVTAGSGTLPYTYAWAPLGGTGATGTGFGAGTYSVTVTDNNGCTAVASVTITQPSLLTATMGVPTNILCNGGTTGSATVSASGGTPAYAYAWAPAGGTTVSGTGLGAGTYTVTVTDNNGCTATAAVTLTQPPLLTATMGVPANVLCNGASNGSAVVTAAGGTPAYTYAWAPAGGTTATGTGLSAGTYTLTLTDANGCNTNATVTITQPAALALTTTSTQATCGNNNGTATVSASGGTPAYVYLWAPSGNTNITATGLGVGTYTVTVTDNNGCTQTATAIVSTPSGITATITSGTSVLCNGGSNGSATVSAAGGATPYTYAWAPAGGTNANATGLTAGTYSVTVTDNGGCVAVASVTITQPPLLTATMGIPTDPTCNGVNNGSATVTASGGTSAYTYAWAPSGGTRATGNAFSAGTYTVTVTDHNGCTATATVTITAPPLLTATIGAPADILCNGGTNGSATVTAAGGSSPYTYSWRPAGGSGATISGMSAGTYSVMVHDNHGCTATAIVIITQPPALSLTLSATNITCAGLSNGSITAAVTGGTSPYTYTWTPSGGNGATASGLSAGTYVLTLTDADGCTTSASATLTEPAALSVSASGPSAICSGANASLTSTVSGGTLPYTYAWSSGATTASAIVNPANTTTYTLTVTDARGCTAVTTLTVTTNQPLSVTVSGAASLCPGDSATLTASASGGDGIYTFLWLPGNNTTQSIIASPGSTTIYTVELTDACGSAMATDTATVSVHPAPLTNFEVNMSSGCVPLCVQFRDLSTVAGGSISQWNWNFGKSDTTGTPDPIFCYPDSGTFSVTLTTTSNNGCRSTLVRSNMITVYPLPRASFTYSPQPVTILSPEVHFTSTSSGKYPLTYWYWTFGDGTDSTSFLVNPVHTYSDTGTYCVTLVVENDHGCVDSVTNCIIVNPDFTLYIPNAFTPNADGLNEVFMPKGTYVKDYEMYIFNRWEAQLFHSTDMSIGWNGKVNGTGSVCQEDTYYYLINITDSKGLKHSYTGMVNLLK